MTEKKVNCTLYCFSIILSSAQKGADDIIFLLLFPIKFNNKSHLPLVYFNCYIIEIKS